MVGRLGQGVMAQQSQSEELPGGRFGRNLQTTQQLRQGAIRLRQQRAEALEEERRMQEQQAQQQPGFNLTSEQKILIATRDALSTRRRRIPDADQLGFSLTRQERSEVSRRIGEAEDRAERMAGQIAVSTFKREVQNLRQQSVTFDPQELKAVARQAIETGFIKVSPEGLVKETKAITIKGDGDNLTQAPMMTRGQGVGGTDISRFTASGIPDFGAKEFNQKVNQFLEKPRGTNQRSIKEEADIIFRGDPLRGLTKEEKDESAKEFIRSRIEQKGFTPGTFEFETKVEKEFKFTQDIITIGKAGALSFAGTTKFPSIIKSPTRTTLNKPSILEFQETVISKGTPRVEATFNIVAERTPPMKILRADAPGGFLSKSDEISIMPSKFTITQTVVPATTRSAITLTTKTGKSFELDILKGVSARIKLDNIKQLTNTQKLLFQRLAESKAGRPVSIENIPKVFSKSHDFNIGEITKISKFKINKLRMIKEPKLGRSTTRFETGSRLRQISETDKFDIFKGEISFKDITRPFTRARGKTTQAKLLIIARKDPIVLDEISEVRIFKPNLNAKRTPLSVTFGRQELVNIPKSLPKIPRVKTQALNKQSLAKVSGISRVSVGSIGFNALRSDSSFTTDFARGFKDFNTNTKAEEKLKFEDLSISKSTSVSASIPKTTNIYVSIPRLIPKEITRSIPKEIVRNVPREITRSIPKEILRQVPRTVPRQPPRTPTLLRPPRGPPRRGPPLIPRFNFKTKSLRTPKLKQMKFDEDLVLSESFSARILNLKPQKIRQKDLGKALLSQKNITRIRLRPIVIPNVMGRKRRKR